MHTKTAILNRLASLRVLTRDVNLKVLQAEEWSSRSRTIVVNMSANASDRLANTAVEKAIVHKNNKVRSGQYFNTLFIIYRKSGNIRVANVYVIFFRVKKIL